VSTTASERTGVIVVRVWTEDAEPPRARITGSSSLPSEERTIAVAAGVEEIVAAVRNWLEEFLASSPN
jgi:hypothetical protein